MSGPATAPAGGQVSCSLRIVLAILAVVVLALSLAPYEGFYTRWSMAGTLVALALALGACGVRDRLLSLPYRLVWGLSLGALLVLATQFGCRYFQHHKDTIARGMALACLFLAGFVCLPAGKSRSSRLVRTGSWISLPHSAEYGQAFVLVAAGLLMTGHGVMWSQLLYGENHRAFQLLVLMTVMGFGGAAAFLVVLPNNLHRFRGGLPRFLFWVGVSYFLVGGAGIRWAAVWAAPDPVIDVYGWLRDAPTFLLRGENPYSASYQSPYGTERAHQFLLYNLPEDRPPVYPPLPILMAVPWAAAGLDVRLANVCCDWAAGVVIFMAGWWRGRPLTGALCAGIYWHFPRAPYVIEQAWFEPMLAAALGTGLLLTERRCRVGYFLLGLGLTGKQYGLVLLPPLARALRHQWARLVLGIVLAVIVVILPFFLWQPKDFLAVVVFKHLERPVGYQSITLLSACHDWFGVDLPPRLLWLPAALLIGWLTWRTPPKPLASSLWLGTTLVIFSLFHTQGHFNYYYLAEYLWLLGIAGQGNPGRDYS